MGEDTQKPNETNGKKKQKAKKPWTWRRIVRWALTTVERTLERLAVAAARM